MPAKTMRLPNWPGVMTVAEFEAIKEFLGVSDAALAEALHLSASSGRTVRRWRAGECEVPGPVATLLRLVVHSPSARELVGLPLGEVAR